MSVAENKDSLALLRRLDYTTDDGAGERARVGLLVLASDHTIEEEFRLLANFPGVTVYHARLGNEEIVTPETLGNMEKELPIAAGLLPGHLGITVLGYGCTSGATIIGEARVTEICQTVHPHVPSTNPITAAKAALQKWGVKRLALLTPYTLDVTQAMQENFDAAGIAVTVVGSFNEPRDSVVGKITPQSILRAVLDVGNSDDCDGVFISCTSLRAATIIAEAEQKLQKPVTASNHALAWHLLRLSGIDDQVSGFGSLFQRY